MRYQSKPGLCGPAAVGNAARVLGMRVPKESVIANACDWANATVDTSPHVIAGIRQLGMSATVHESRDAVTSWAWLTMHLREGRPVICCVMNWGHWVTAIGMVGDRIIVTDPSNVVTNKRENGTVVRAKSDWLRQWKNSREGLFYGISVGRGK